MDRTIEYRRLRAPRGHGQLHASPPLDEVAALVTRNRARASEQCYDFGGRCWRDLAQEARRELLAAARCYTAEYRDVPAEAADPAGPVLLAGHQPELFHPGVWLKNFALANLAADQQGVGVNLVIDSDRIKSAAIRVPTGSIAEPRVEAIAFDRSAEPIPFEERPVLDRELFASFAKRTSAAIRALIPDPLVNRLWPLAIGRLEAGMNLGVSIAQSRHCIEGEWGAATLELPQSRLCRFTAYHWFVAHLLANLPRLWQVHNDALAEYRCVHHLRSAAHPVPDLVRSDDWLEAPLWVWTDTDPSRRRIFVRQQAGQVVLTDRRQVEVRLDLSPEAGAARAAEQLADAARRGIKIRTRAIVTTLFARLFLGDVFLHGIGGAKYDQVTDLIVERFLGIEPPEFVTVSATALLPISRAAAERDDLRRTAQALRELKFHPERYLETAELPAADRQTVAALAATKREAVAQPKTLDNARQRHQAISAANLALQPWVEPQRQKLLGQSGRLGELLRAETVLASREYAFCLFPEKSLRNLILELVRAKS
jgi:hypothetical protein